MLITCTGADLGYRLRRSKHARSNEPYLQTLLEVIGCPRQEEIPVHVRNRREPGDTCEYSSGQQMSKRAPSTTQLLVITGLRAVVLRDPALPLGHLRRPDPVPGEALPGQSPLQRGDPAGRTVGRADLRRQRRQSPERSSWRRTSKQALATVDIEDQYAPLPGGHAGDPAHQDAARRDLHRTDAGLEPGTGAGRRRHAARGQHRRIGPARRDLPHLRPRDPRRLPGLDAGSGGRDQRPGPEPLLRARRTRTDLHRIRHGSSAPSTASGWRSASCSATAPPPSAPCAAAKASWPT